MRDAVIAAAVKVVMIPDRMDHPFGINILRCLLDQFIAVFFGDDQGRKPVI